MTWSYDTGLSGTKDQIRLLIGDTDATDPQLQDEEITFIASQESGIYRGAAQCAFNIAAKYTRQVTRSFGGRSDQLSQLATQYRTLGKELLAKAAKKRISVYAGGQSIAEKDSQAKDTDAVQPIFSKNTFRNPATQSAEDFGDYPNAPSDWTNS